MKTLAQLRTLARNLAFEYASDIGLTDVAQLDDLINSSHRWLYNLAVETTPSLFQKKAPDQTVTATGLDFSGTKIDALGVHSIRRLDLRDVAGTYVPMEPMTLDEVPGRGGSAPTASFISRYYREGFVLFTHPLPTTNVTLRLTYVPNIADLTLVGDLPFLGELADFHELVAFDAAVMALEKDKAAMRLVPRRDSMLKQFKDYILRLQKQKPRMVRRTDDFD